MKLKLAATDISIYYSKALNYMTRPQKTGLARPDAAKVMLPFALGHATMAVASHKWQHVLGIFKMVFTAIPTPLSPLPLLSPPRPPLNPPLISLSSAFALHLFPFPHSSISSLLSLPSSAVTLLHVFPPPQLRPTPSLLPHLIHRHTPPSPFLPLYPPRLSSSPPPPLSICPNLHFPPPPHPTSLAVLLRPHLPHHSPPRLPYWSSPPATYALVAWPMLTGTGHATA